MKLSEQEIELFRETVWDYYRSNARPMPWRDSPTPYFVLVSELMLQQTQVSRVLPKFQEFIELFPDFPTLARAPLSQVLTAWSGLGYNRRAKFLHQTAIQVMQQHGGQLPATKDALVKLPGIGPNTAGAILAYAYNQPVVFVETNIRTVYFYHFFATAQQVPDSEIIELLTQTIDPENPREWYWALMDYGTHLKVTQGNNVSQSKHYTRQSKFVGSHREIRGKILRLLIVKPFKTADLLRILSDERAGQALKELQLEGLITEAAGELRLTDTPELP